MLYIPTEDKPGYIGRLGSLLGDAKVNIATFHLGRERAGGEAIALVQVDQPIDSNLLGKISALEGVKQARVLGF
jgi:D-3-phosphoglycerate dehydrogenase